MEIEDEAQLSMRDRIENVLKNGLEEDNFPKDTEFYMLYYQMKLEGIIDDFLFDYLKEEPFKQVMSDKIIKSETERIETTTEDIYNKICKLQSVKDLIRCLIEAEEEPDFYEMVYNSLTERNILDDLQRRNQSFIRNNILKIPVSL